LIAKSLRRDKGERGRTTHGRTTLVPHAVQSKPAGGTWARCTVLARVGERTAGFDSPVRPQNLRFSRGQHSPIGWHHGSLGDHATDVW